MPTDTLIPPYGAGTPISAMAPPHTDESLRRETAAMSSIDLRRDQLSLLEMLLNGSMAPLTGYMGAAACMRVLTEFRLPNGTFWPLPALLDISAAAAEGLKPGMRAALRDPEGFALAVLDVDEVWAPNQEQSAMLTAAYGDWPPSGAVSAFERRGTHFVGGRLTGLSVPVRHDFPGLRWTPEEARRSFEKRGWRKVVAYQTREPIHRVQFEVSLRAAMAREANLFLQLLECDDPFANPEYFPRVRSVQAALDRYPTASTALCVLPLSLPARNARAILLRAIVARNYGATHLIVGGEQQVGGLARRGDDIATAQVHADVARYIGEVGVEILPFPRMLYAEERAEYVREEDIQAGGRTQIMRTDEINRRLAFGLSIPEWAAFPEVIEELRRAHPPRNRRGFTVFFTGFSGSGKSTLARVLTTKLLEIGSRRVTLLDGDVVRKHLSNELGFSRAHRDINIRRIGFVASEITKNNGVAICAPIAPYAETRRAVREMIEPLGGFFEVHVSTPLDVCEARDRKGLYARARAGLLPEFTGISDPYEVPEQPELSIDTSNISVDAAVQRILLKLEQEGYLR